jgi:NitT/TauT family transport system permease protein
MKISQKSLDSGNFRHVIYGGLSFLFILILWSLLTYSGFIKPFFLPTPTDVGRSMIDLFIRFDFLNDIFISIFRIVTGFIIATLIAIPMGIGLGINKKFQAFIEPVVDFIRYTPIPAFIPLFILWFGIGEIEKIIVIVAAVFFQLVLMIANSVSHVPREMKEFALSLGATRRELVTKVIFQHSKPRIFDDLRVSMGWAWAGLMIAEIVGATSGIGFVIIQSQRLLQTSNVISAIIVVGILGLVTDFLFKSSYDRVFPWSRR